MALIQNLVARLRGDTAQFDRSMNKSRATVTRFGMDIKRMGQQMLAAAGIGGGIYALTRGLKAIVGAAAEQERVERLLTAAVKGNIDTFKKYAAGIQRVTIYGDEEILSQMAYAKNLGVTTSQLEKATTAAIGLAAKFRLDLATSMMLVGRASQGQTQMLTRYGIVLDESLSIQEKFNKLLEIGANAFRLAEEEALTATGTWRQFKSATGDLAEELGGPLLNNLTKVERALINFNQLLRDAKEEQKNMTFPFMTPPESFWDLQNRGPKALTEEQELEAFAKKWNAQNEAFAESIKAQNKERIDAMAISKSFLANIDKEIQLTGLVGDARQHAAKAIDMQNKLQEKGLLNTIAGREEVEKLDIALKKLEGAQKLARIAEDIGSAFADAFTDMIFEAKRFGDVMKALLKDIARSVVRNVITTPLANSITMALGGQPALVTHRGGTVGHGGAMRQVSPMLFAGAPRLHSGLMGDEFPAILQRGERVIPKGGGGGIAPTINIINQSGQPMSLGGQPSFDGEKWVINIVANNVQRGGQLRKLLQK